MFSALWTYKKKNKKKKTGAWNSLFVCTLFVYCFFFVCVCFFVFFFFCFFLFFFVFCCCFFVLFFFFCCFFFFLFFFCFFSSFFVVVVFDFFAYVFIFRFFFFFFFFFHSFFLITFGCANNCSTVWLRIEWSRVRVLRQVLKKGLKTLDRGLICVRNIWNIGISDKK